MEKSIVMFTLKICCVSQQIFKIQMIRTYSLTANYLTSEGIGTESVVINNMQNNKISVFVHDCYGKLFTFDSKEI